MGTRKRHGGGKGPSDKSEVRNKPKKPAESSSGGAGIVFLTMALLVFVGVTAGFYFFQMGDVNTVIDNIQSKAASYMSSDAKDSPSAKDEEAPKIPAPPVPETNNFEEPDGSKIVTPDAVKNKAVKDEPPPVKEPIKPAYSKADITSEYDYPIREALDKADKLVEQKRPMDALLQYQAILEHHPQSPRAQYGIAWATDVLSELERSNEHLEQCITEYTRLLSFPNVPRELMLKSGRRAADRQSFRGWSNRAVKTIRLLLDFFPDDLDLLRDLGVQNLMIGRNEEAHRVFQKILMVSPDDGFAKVHIGFILKSGGDHEGAIPYLQEGIATNEPGTQDGRFYFHLGDALQRVGQKDEAYKIYEAGAVKGFFRSKYQRSLYNVDHLTARPWWTAKQTGNKKYLEEIRTHWETIRDEGLAQMDHNKGVFKQEDENLRETGDWRQLTLYSRGQKHTKNCEKTPKTCAIVEKFKDATGCTRGQIKYSVMEGGVHVWPHCGPTNCRIRAHLGLVVPEGPRIRVVNETRTWEEGQFMVFDDSFEHEVWHDGDSFRLVLIIDMWHPELSEYEKRTLTAI